MIRILPDLIKNAAHNYSEKIAVMHNDTSITYGRIFEKSLKLRQALSHSGIKKGDRICFYLEKCIEKVISIFGISLSGGVIVPIRRLSKAQQAAFILNNCKARALITTSVRIPGILQYIHQLPGLKTIITIDKVDEISLPAGITLLSWETIMAVKPVEAPDKGVIEKDIAAILYTSGSTGKPKGVVLSHLNIIAGTKIVSEYLKINTKDRLLSILTFGFDYGLNQLTTAFSHGAQIILLDYLFPGDIIKAVEKYHITGLAAVATTWIQLLQISWDKTAMNNLRFITNSGGRIPPNYVADLRKRLPETDVYLMYGLTEAFRSTYLEPCLVDHYPDSIGKAVPGEEIMVLDKNDQPVKPGQLGELVHRGVLVGQGYWDDPELTATRFRNNPLQPKEVSSPEKVVYSGDYVRIDNNGFLYFVGRKDEMIKCAGNRISPTEVEDILYKVEGVSDVVAFGMPHGVYGQIVCAVVSPLNSREIHESSLKAYCRQNMPPFMIPAKIEIRKTLPRNANGKLDRAAIKKEVYTKHRKLDTDEHRLSGL